MGERLAALARRNLASFPGVHVEVGLFEDRDVPKEAFDAVVCANAFHWIDPTVRYAKAAAALRPGGVLAILSVDWVRGGTPGFTQATQRCYMRYGLGADPNFELPLPDDVPDRWPELASQAGFTDIERRRFDDVKRYTAASYVGMLSTQSNVNSLGTVSREKFLECIRNLVETEFQGSVERRYLYQVVSARRTQAMSRS